MTARIDVTTESNTPTMMAWDTDFWGIRIGRAEHLDGVSEWAVENAVGLMCLLVDTIIEVQAAVDIGYRLTDVRVTLDRRPSVYDQSCRRATAGDAADLREIAGSAYRGLTRFYADETLSAKADDLYRRWITADVEGAADAVFVRDRDGAAAGYVSVKADRGVASIGLIAVKADMHHQGVGWDLMLDAVTWAKQSGCSRIEVVTQGCNIPALRLFQRAGFRHSRTQFWLHKRYL